MVTRFTVVNTKQCTKISNSNVAHPKEKKKSSLVTKCSLFPLTNKGVVAVPTDGAQAAMTMRVLRGHRYLP